MKHNEIDPWQILGVPRDASPEDIKKAYRDLSKKHHPDVGGDPDKMKEINVAYDILSDPNKKQIYENPEGGNGFNPFSGNPFNNPFGGNPFDGINLADLFNNIHGFRFETNMRGGPQGFTTNIINHAVVVPLTKALSGGEVQIHIGAIGKTIRFPLPKGCQSGSTFRIRIAGSERNQTILDLTVKVEIPTLPIEKIDAIIKIIQEAPIVAQEPAEPTATNQNSGSL